jgi:hypothetical protein
MPTVISTTASRYAGESIQTLSDGSKVRVKTGTNRSGAGTENSVDTSNLRENLVTNTPIDASKLGQPEIKLPKSPTATNQNSLITSNNLGLASGLTEQGTTYDTKTGQFVYTPPKEAPQDNAKTLLDSYLNNLPQAPSAEAIYNNLPGQKDLKKASADVNNYTAQLNTIVAKSQADQLSLTGQGRGVPEAIIGGQQAQISKEAAIQALPLQALLANAQANKELAQTHIDTLFKLRMEDAQSQYQYKTKVLETVYNYATAQERQRLDAIQRKEDQAFTLKRDNISFAQQLAGKAIEYGNTSAFRGLTGLNPDSPTYQQDLAKYGEQIGLETNPSGVNENAVALANTYNQSGTLPSPADLKAANTSFAEVARLAKELPKQFGAVVDANTGVKSSKVDAKASDDFGSLYNIFRMTEKLKLLDAERGKGLVNGVLGKVTGLDESQNGYLTLRNAIVDEIARMQSGAALTAEEQSFYKEYLPGRFSNAFYLGQSSNSKIDDFASIMKNKLDSGLANYGLSVYGYSKVKLGDQEYTVGQKVKSPDGRVGTVLPDGSVSVPDSFKSEGSVSVNAKSVADAISFVESGGKQVKGASGEFGAFQFMPATWNIISKQTIGKVIPQTPENERMVAETKIQGLLDQGYSPKEVALIWNTSLGGSEKPMIKKGVNAKGVAYDSESYANKVLKALKA